MNSDDSRIEFGGNVGRLVSSVHGTFEVDHIAIAIHRQALDDALSYSGEQLYREMGGFLLGQTYERERTIVEIRQFSRALHTRSALSSLTFTHETWADVHRRIDEYFPGERILGWHHTHPGMGVFMSSHDLFIQQHFFPEPWHIGLVVDPRRRELGFFQWNRRRVVDCGFAVVEFSDA